jgi:hypothetical protein
MWDARGYLNFVPVVELDATMYVDGDELPESSVQRGLAAAVEAWLTLKRGSDRGAGRQRKAASGVTARALRRWARRRLRGEPSRSSPVR